MSVDWCITRRPRWSLCQALSNVEIRQRLPESGIRKAYPHLVFCELHEKSKPFAGWEQSQLLTEGLRDTFREVR